MANKAQAALESLLGAGGMGPPEAGEFDIVNEEESPRSQAQSASFSKPEALATGVAASFILGPVGGLLMGLAQGYLGKKEQQNMLDQESERLAAIDAIEGEYADTFDTMRSTATNPDDVQQVNGMQTQFEASGKAMASRDPKIQEAGIRMREDALKQISEYNTRQETQRLAKEGAEAQAIKDIGKENYDRYVTTKGRFDKESSAYLSVRNSAAGVRASLAEGTPAGQYAAIKLLEKSLDPTSAVRPEEQAAWGQMAGARETVNIYLNKLANGEILSDDQMIEIRSLVDAVEGVAYESQRRIESRYSNETEDIRLDSKYRDNFILTDEPPIAVKAKANKPGSGTTGELGDDVTTVEPDGIEGLAGSVLANLLEGGGRVLEDARRKAAGIRLVKRSDGMYIEVNPDGTTQEIGRDRLHKDARGNVYELIDHGNGRTEWRLLEEANAPQGKLESMNSARAAAAASFPEIDMQDVMTSSMYGPIAAGRAKALRETN